MSDPEPRPHVYSDYAVKVMMETGARAAITTMVSEHLAIINDVSSVKVPKHSDMGRILASIEHHVLAIKDLQRELL